MSALPSISALVVTYHTGPRLHECLYALKGDADITEIIIVDNGNPPAQQAWIDRFVAGCAKASLIREGGNAGFGRAMNRAAELAKLGRNRDNYRGMKESIYGENAAINQPHGAAYMLANLDRYH